MTCAKTPTSDGRSERLPRWLFGYSAAVVVLAVHFLIAVTSVREKSNVFDEITHITAGFSYWITNDYRLPAENGLPQRWLTLPLLTMGLEFPGNGAQWESGDVWKIGDRFFFRCGNDLDAMLRRARAMNALVSVGLGLLVYAWSRRLFGPVGGMLSLSAYAMDPTILANCSVATSDFAAAAFFAASIGCLWWLFHRVSPGSIVCAWLALAGLLLSKVSAVLIVPIGAALLILRLVGRRPLRAAFGRWERTFDGWPTQLSILCGVMLLQMALVVATIWAFFGFRYSAFHEPLSGNERFIAPWEYALDGTGVFGEAVKFARDKRLLPEGYLFGSTWVYRQTQQRAAFLNGQYSTTGWWYFFPYTFLVKTPLATFVVLLLAGAGAVCTWRQMQPREGYAARAAAWQGFYATAPLWFLLAVYWVMAITSRLNIGHRHLLPIYPVMLILLGAAGHWFRQPRRLGWLTSSAAVACVLALAGDCYAMYPHYLAYFNRIAGGPKNGYKHLVDSSLDWGQDLPGLKRWLQKNGLDGQSKTPVYLFYPGTSDPLYYGIHAIEIWNARAKFMVPLQAGVYCVSATDLQCEYRLAPWSVEYEMAYREASESVHLFNTADQAARARMLRTEGEDFWNQLKVSFESLRISRLCAFLRRREPDDNVGYSILIYWLSDKDIHDALVGPPTWLDARLGPAGDFDQADGLSPLAAGEGDRAAPSAAVSRESQQQTRP